MIVRRLQPGDEANEPAMRLYESLVGVRPHDDDVMWDFQYADS